ncbi:MAG: type VI secretion system baseplate subunit TssE [Aliishimia sp.]
MSRTFDDNKTRPPRTPEGRRQVSLMHVFRASAESRSSRFTGSQRQEDGRTVTVRTKQKREGVDESELRRHLNMDLNALMNTIRLDAVVNLDTHPYVAKSILNYGFTDMSSLTRSEKTDHQIAASIRQSLIDHEPRLIPESIEITIIPINEAAAQKVSFEISAELVAEPADIPLDFVAEVDLGAGKMKLNRFRVQG